MNGPFCFVKQDLQSLCHGKSQIKVEIVAMQSGQFWHHAFPRPIRISCLLRKGWRRICIAGECDTMISVYYSHLGFSEPFVPAFESTLCSQFESYHKKTKSLLVKNVVFFSSTKLFMCSFFFFLNQIYITEITFRVIFD